jgi:TPR repeat protein
MFEQAAAAGAVDGLRELGRMCEKGIAGPVDTARARALYEEAAELFGDAFSRDRLVSAFGLTWYA